MEKNDQHISDSLFRLAGQLSGLDSQAPRQMEEGERIPAAEMRLVVCTGDAGEICGADLAQRLGVTRGAVSQTAAKLEKRGVLQRRPDPQNRARVLFSLTEKGQRLHQVHRQFHQQLDELVQQTLAGASEENRRFLQQFLDAVEHKILGMYF